MERCKEGFKKERKGEDEKSGEIQRRVKKERTGRMKSYTQCLWLRLQKYILKLNLANNFFRDPTPTSANNFF